MDEQALAAIAGLVRAGGDRSAFEDRGIRVPPAGPAQRRFSARQPAVHLRPATDLFATDHETGNDEAGGGVPGSDEHRHAPELSADVAWPGSHGPCLQRTSR